jgi:hypothetical protein
MNVASRFMAGAGTFFNYPITRFPDDSILEEVVP